MTFRLGEGWRLGSIREEKLDQFKKRRVRGTIVTSILMVFNDQQPFGIKC